MAARKLPTSFREILVQKLGTNFREVTKVVSKPLPELKDKEVLIKNRYVGINASDINFSAGRYFSDPSIKPPFPCGFEGLGEVAAVGSNAKMKPGQFVTYSQFGAFSEYIVVPEKLAVPVPACDPRFLTILVSGLTASISLEKLAKLEPGKTVLVTAAAGGTGQYAVQLAKLAGCHVIGTCSSEEKISFLKSIGCDRPIDYKKEDLQKVLSKEYPKGIDVVYESVGAGMFKAAVRNLAKFGQLIIIGQISTYTGKNKVDEYSAAATAMTLLTKSASMHGFFLMDYNKDIPSHAMKLSQLMMQNKLKLEVDKGDKCEVGPFVGLDCVADAVEYMYKGGNIGKVVVELGSSTKSNL